MCGALRSDDPLHQCFFLCLMLKKCVLNISVLLYSLFVLHTVWDRFFKWCSTLLLNAYCWCCVYKSICVLWLYRRRCLFWLGDDKTGTWNWCKVFSAQGQKVVRDLEVGGYWLWQQCSWGRRLSHLPMMRRICVMLVWNVLVWTLDRGPKDTLFALDLGPYLVCV